MSYQGPTTPKDATTVLTRVFDSSNGALKVVTSSGAAGASIKLATYTSGVILQGAGVDFVITQDIDASSIANKIYIPQLVIIPSASSMYRVRLFARNTRVITDPMWYEWPYAGNLLYTNDVTGFWYWNLMNTNSIYGRIDVNTVSANPASYAIYILFQS